MLILISNSGESAELKNIIQHANRNKNIVLIGIVSKKNSLLYKNSDLKILLPEVKEAGPGNIVPTSSTIMQLAIGDAIAISTMRQKNFGEKEFKKFHPSGSIGAKLKTVEEKNETNPESFYTLSKSLAEKQCEFFSNNFNLNIIILRVCSIFGPRLKRQIIYKIIKELRNNKKNLELSGKLTESKK